MEQAGWEAHSGGSQKRYSREAAGVAGKQVFFQENETFNLIP